MAKFEQLINNELMYFDLCALAYRDKKFVIPDEIDSCKKYLKFLYQFKTPIVWEEYVKEKKKENKMWEKDGSVLLFLKIAEHLDSIRYSGRTKYEFFYAVRRQFENRVTGKMFGAYLTSSSNGLFFENACWWNTD